MAKKAGKRPSRRTTRRKYTTPRLVVHGDLRALTRTKAGTKTDGTGKPATRDLGGTS